MAQFSSHRTLEPRGLSELLLPSSLLDTPPSQGWGAAWASGF